jgi:anti-anti-sigma regulatory factor
MGTEHLAMGASIAITLHPRSHRHGSRARGDSAPDEAAVSSGVLMAIVNAQGVLDARRVEPFAAEVGHALEAGATRLLVDLSRADDVAAAYQNTLLAARQRLFACGGRIAVVLSPAMRRRFGVLGLDRRFLLAKDRMHGVRLLGLAETAPARRHAPRPHAHAA